MSSYVIGLTGGIAAGKSAVAARFQDLGIVVADADIAARAAVAPGSPGLAAVVARFGAGVLDASGALDRLAMRRRVFADPDARSALEAIVHPLVRTALEATCMRAEGTYAVAAIPLLSEGGGRDAYPWLDRILVVDAPTQAQFARLLLRDGIDHDLAGRMLAAQATRAQRLAIADDVIVNTGGLETLDASVAELDARYRRLASLSKSARHDA